MHERIERVLRVSRFTHGGRWSRPYGAPQLTIGFTGRRTIIDDIAHFRVSRRRAVHIWLTPPDETTAREIRTSPRACRAAAIEQRCRPICATITIWMFARRTDIRFETASGFPIRGRPTVGPYIRPGVDISPTRRVECRSDNPNLHGVTVIDRGAGSLTKKFAFRGIAPMNANVWLCYGWAPQSPGILVFKDRHAWYVCACLPFQKCTTDD